MRTSALSDVAEDGKWFGDKWVRIVKYKMKPLELAKPGKYPRGIGDMGVKGCIRGGHLMDKIKSGFAVPHVLSRPQGLARFEFTKSPSKKRMSDVFRRLINPEWFEFHYHSDDSCIAVRCADGIFRANVDISCCDGSNGDNIFRVLHAASSCGISKNALDATFAQCRSPIKVTSVRNRRESFVLQPRGYVLYSGSVLTTAINNTANMTIGLSVLHLIGVRVPLVAEMSELVRRAAERVGYIVTIEECSSVVEKIQFLKHSPIKDVNGSYVPVLNLGVIIRTFGQCDDVLPGQRRHRCPKRRTEMFNTGLVRGLVHAGCTSLLRSLQARYCDRRRIAKEYLPTEVRTIGDDDSIDPNVPIDEFSLGRRYGLTPVQLEELSELVKLSEYGVGFSSVVAHRILMCDYSLSGRRFLGA